MSWLPTRRPGPKSQEKREVPDGIWLKCPGCAEILYRKEVERNSWVCMLCGHHFRISADDYISILIDPESFEESFDSVVSIDPLGFVDSKPYPERIAAARGKNRHNEAIVTGKARIESVPIGLGVMDFKFLGGSMGSAVGERIARIADLCLEEEIPLVLVSASGGARMQEGILSLMQLAKVQVQLARLGEKGIFYLSIICDPTTGGVTASFATVGDIILAEPNALIGFAGPRVIQQTIKQDLPEGFQRSEFLLDHGMIDAIVPRAEMRATVGRILHHFWDSRPARLDRP
ncbi:MAG: acetyl-CoA carboxylase carboxyltransferase subunit beta [Candidatus Eisenbacteria bacterium]|nr:acetyl-CoA carboxylase carboxyltransferase subunit beta [Candidatus Latescibacterota bacterium]MBD3301567.1 acetyl-CoA carboxylase carboxyltransferase subunit beta [Candidatus Eisenbacteria bacterium]